MTRKVYVTSAQVDAARLIVERSAARGQPVSDAIRMIAEAVPEPAASGGTDSGGTETAFDRTIA
ncbi:MAG TPA: hypothetical protein VGX49_01585 [Jatrophihabitans sp.]|jgi:Flp pilus assembly protein TadB|nr:hypothetical protein [Jatrophihabitans sp.]